MQITLSVLALVASASAHMILEFPVPYGNPTSSPLNPTGANFPCQATGPESYSINKMNEWNAGETKDISFLGSAVHGGGSCQFSVTTDDPPTKESTWKVIHSVIGGCPSNVTGNLPTDEKGHKAATFPVTLPSDLPSGKYTFAWTWFNKVGNREMYMNCAPVNVGGGSSASAKDASSFLGGLPDMFVANLPHEACSTKEGEDFEFPNPGNSVSKGDQATPGSTLADNGGCAQQAAMGGGSGSIGSPSKPDTPSQPSSPAASPTNPGGIFAPGASSAAPSAPASTKAPSPPEVPAPIQTPSPSEAPSPIETPSPSEAPSPTAAPAPTGIPAPSPPTSGSSVPCDTDGAIVCIGSNQFGMCDRGFAYPMALAAGTTCSNGKIDATVSRRSIRFPRAHLHRRHGSGL